MPPKKEAATEAKKRGPVKYMAFAEIAPGWWALVSANRESANVYSLRKELRAEVSQAQQDAGVEGTDAHRLVLIPVDQAHVVEAKQEVTVKETFEKVELEDGPPLASMIQGPPTGQPTEADVAARMGSGVVPEGAVTTFPPAVVTGEQASAMLAPYSGDDGAAHYPILGPDDAAVTGATVSGEITTPEFRADAAARAAQQAEEQARAAAVLPVDPEDDDEEDRGNPDVGPDGVSRRRASEATPADEATVIFPIDDA